MRGWCSITPFDGVADWCCRANAELLRNWPVMDGSFARVMFILMLICIFVCICGTSGFRLQGPVPISTRRIWPSDKIDSLVTRTSS